MSSDLGHTADEGAEISALIETLIYSEERLKALTGGEIDSVSDSRGRVFLFSHAQEQLRLNETAKQVGILNSLPSPVALLDKEGVIVSVNHAWRQSAATNVMTGGDAGAGLNYLHFCDHLAGEHGEEGRAASMGIQSVLAGRQESFSLEYPCDSASDRRWFLLTVSPLGVTRRNGAFVMHLDITERKGLQAQLLQSQKMESIGSLAGGIAHDFNNLLTGMLGFAELAQLRLPADSPVQEDLLEIRTCAERGARLIKELVSFARKEVVVPQVVNVGEAVDGLRNLIQRLAGARIDVRIETGANDGCIRLDPSQLEQVLVNLAVNACDAMPRGGTLTIAVSNRVVDEVDGGRDGLPEPGEYVFVSVTDTGSGMSKKIQERAFDPFFTTKEKGKGTGLGLSTCHGIVTSGGGRISIASEMDVGTTFRIFFPRVDGPVARPAAKEETITAMRGETILLVDDEVAVRSFAAEILSRFGYRVLSVASGVDALTVAAQSDQTIDLLLSDVEMPGMTGPELVEAMEFVIPELKVLFMSGFSSDPQLQEWAEARRAFLQKPFSSAQLSKKVWEVLNTNRA